MHAEVNLREAGDIVFLSVRARAGGRRNEISGVHAGALKVEVTTAPEKGKANKAIIKLLSKYIGIPARDIQIKNGETSSDKVFAIRGISASLLLDKILAHQQ